MLLGLEEEEAQICPAQTPPLGWKKRGELRQIGTVAQYLDYYQSVSGLFLSTKCSRTRLEA